MNPVTMRTAHVAKAKPLLDGGFGLQGGQVTAGMADLLAMTGAELAFEHSGCFLERFLFFQVVNDNY